jgi:thioredoxin reductase (NADPH)
MTSEKIYPVCVIGGGSAGTMAVLRTVLNNDECLFFPGTPQNKKKSRALWVRKVENVPAHFNYKRGIEEPNAETLKWIDASEFKNKLVLQKNKGVNHIEKEGDLFHITDSDGNRYLARFVILCTGVMDIQPEITGTIETVFDYANAQTIDYCLICDGHHVLNKKTAVIGFDNSAAWVSIMLHERYSPPELTIITNGKPALFEPETMKLIQLYGIKVEEAEVRAIQGREKGKILEAFELTDGTLVNSDIAFVSLGMLVYNQLAKMLGADLDARGFVKTDSNGESTVPGLFVAGDLRASTRKQIYTAWDSAVSSAITINQKLRVSKRESLLKNFT